MTFVINKKIQLRQNFENVDYLFDVEQYNYMIDRKTALTNEKLINNPSELAYVLKKFSQIDIVLLD